MSITTKRKPIIIGMTIGILLLMAICYFLTDWRGPVVILSTVATITGIVRGALYLSQQLGKSRWRRSAILSFTCGLMLVWLIVLSFLYSNPSILYIMDFILSGVLVILIISFVMFTSPHKIARIFDRLKR